jgi:hypothetical protein
MEGPFKDGGAARETGDWIDVGVLLLLFIHRWAVRPCGSPIAS